MLDPNAVKYLNDILAELDARCPDLRKDTIGCTMSTHYVNVWVRGRRHEVVVENTSGKWKARGFSHPAPQAVAGEILSRR